MFRPSVSPRLIVGFTLAATVGAGIGLGLVGLGAASGTAPAPAGQTVTVAASTAAASAPAPAGPSASTPLTADQASAIAVQASPGTVVEVKQENADNGNTEANDPTETNDPTEATGLVYDVTVQHQDGSDTKVVVDGATGHVVSTEAEDAGN